MKFEVGKWYKYTGTKARKDFWNPGGRMDFVLDGEPHLCKKSIPGVMKEEQLLGWYWGEEDCFVEVPAPDSPFTQSNLGVE